MIIWRIAGWSLLVVAFIFTAAEAMVHAILNEYGFIAASRVLETLEPEFLAAFEAAVDSNLHPLLWDPVLLSLMQLPGWLLLGTPGVFLIWYFRDRSPSDFDLPENFPHTTYEDIVAAAEEAEYDDIGLPSKYRDLADYDPTEPYLDGALEHLPETSRQDDLSQVETPEMLDVARVVQNLTKIGLPPGRGSEGGDKD